MHVACTVDGGGASRLHEVCDNLSIYSEICNSFYQNILTRGRCTEGKWMYLCEI
jgi:hypothetical protein